MATPAKSSSPIERVLIVGAGTMGLGVAKSFAEGGFKTSIWSRRGANVPGLPKGIAASADLPADAPDLVIENVPEDFETKLACYRALEAAFPPSVIIATNTSGLPLDALAKGLKHPERFLGAHYFQSADVFPMVEVIGGSATEKHVVERVAEAMRRTGKEPILVRKPVEGYLINRLQHAILHEAYYLIEIGAATAYEVDQVAKYLLGPRMCVTGLIEQKDIGGSCDRAQARPHTQVDSLRSGFAQARRDRSQGGAGFLRLDRVRQGGGNGAGERPAHEIARVSRGWPRRGQAENETQEPRPLEIATADRRMAKIVLGEVR